MRGFYIDFIYRKSSILVIFISYIIMRTKPRFLKPWWLVLFIVIIFFVWKILFFSSSFWFDKSITIEKGDTIQKITDMLPYFTQLKFKWYVKHHTDLIQSLQPGSYTFSWNYTSETLLDTINRWPQRSFMKVTLLEGWSIYDIDDYLAKRWYISSHDYINYVTSADNIIQLAKKYPFLQQFIDTQPKNWSAISLEWLLYPDTYHLSENQPLIPQLIALQLKAFQKKVIDILGSDIASYPTTLHEQWYSFSLWLYNIVTLASIVEKEERNQKNKPLIAGIFLNRIQKDMRLDADITLCYGLQEWYEQCTPQRIVTSLWDTTNNYNTRQHIGLTPGPIANPSIETIQSVLHFEKTDNMYYLHDSNWQIWVSSTLDGHNQNKANHL